MFDDQKCMSFFLSFFISFLNRCQYVYISLILFLVQMFNYGI